MGFRIPHFQHFPPFASIIFLSFLIFQHPPCPPRWAHGLPLFSVSPGFSPWAPAWQELYVSQAVKCRGAGGGIPWRHLLDPPRGRGPSQTPPSLATDSSISPGPPSPWLPALFIGHRLLPFSRRTVGSAPGMQGAKPLAWNNLGLPLPVGKGVGGMGAKKQTKVRGGG